jgi:hypothetical protein
MDYEYRLAGELLVERQDRETGEWLEPLRADNTITTVGKHRFLQALVGQFEAGVSTVMGAGASRLVLLDGSNNVVRRRVLLQATYPKVKSAEEKNVMHWRWADEEANMTYTVANARIERSEHGGVETAATDYIFSTISANLGLKPTTENWFYTYQLTLSSASPAFVPTYGSTPEDGGAPVEYVGLQEMVAPFAGVSSVTWLSNVLNLTAYDWDNPNNPQVDFHQPGLYPPNSQSRTAGYVRGQSDGQFTPTLVNQSGVGTPDRIELVFKCTTDAGMWRLIEISRLSRTVKLMGFSSATATTNGMQILFTINITLT